MTVLTLVPQANHIHSLDPHMINNAMECIKHDFSYDIYIDWLNQFTCTEKPDLKLNRLDELTYTTLATLTLEK